MTMLPNQGCATGLTWNVRARMPADRDGIQSCKAHCSRAPALPGGAPDALPGTPLSRTPSPPAGESRLGDGREPFWSAGIPARPHLLPPRLWSSARRFPSRFTQAHPAMTMLPIRRCASGLTWNVRARMPADRDGTQCCKTLPARAPALPGGAHHALPGSPICLSRSPPAGEWRLADGREPLWSAGIPARPLLLPPRLCSSSRRLLSRFTQAHPSVTMFSNRGCGMGPTWDVRARMPADRDGTQSCKTLPARAPALPGGAHHASRRPPHCRSPSPATSARSLGGDLIPEGPHHTPPSSPHFRVPSPPREGRSERVPPRRTTAPPPRW